MSEQHQSMNEQEKALEQEVGEESTNKRSRLEISPPPSAPKNISVDDEVEPEEVDLLINEMRQIGSRTREAKMLLWTAIKNLESIQREEFQRAFEHLLC